MHDKLTKLVALLESVGRKVCFMPPQTKISKQKWTTHSQEGEFNFHVTNEWRKTSGFVEENNALFRHFGFDPDDFDKKIVIDLGAGSRLRAKFFRHARIFAIDPLADRFMKEIDWCDLNDAEKVYSLPAEQLIEDCIGKADFLFSINVLDHCFHFKEVINNIKSYLTDDGIAFLSFDKHRIADDMHPLELTEEICETTFEKLGLTILKSSTGMGTVHAGRQTYGHGPYCLNYWVKKTI